MTAIALTIAGSDSGGGAGIQADLKTFSALGVYGASAVTAITAQNTKGVAAVEPMKPEMVTAQIEAVLSDIDVGAIKIGMAANAEIIEAIAASLLSFGRRAIVDPVMVATSGDRLLETDAVLAMRTRLLPFAQLVTPNLHEAAILAGEARLASTESDMIRQAERIREGGAEAVLVKGGHGKGREAVDILLVGSEVHRLAAPRLATTSDHGTGCTLSAAITAGLAKGQGLLDATRAGKDYLHAALAAASGLRIGSGRGPVHHFHALW